LLSTLVSCTPIWSAFSHPREVAAGWLALPGPNGVEVFERFRRAITRVRGDTWKSSVDDERLPDQELDGLAHDGREALQLGGDAVDPDALGQAIGAAFTVTATKVLPVASSSAVTVTPGNTPPVESATVPGTRLLARARFPVQPGSRAPGAGDGQPC
jgi:hypothetical protein